MHEILITKEVSDKLKPSRCWRVFLYLKMNIVQAHKFLIDANYKVCIDHRKAEKGFLFFAFSGKNFNAAAYANEAIQKGCTAVFVEDKKYEDPANQIFFVEKTESFLQDLAKYHRESLTIPIIGLTGSNGKTTTKELISAALSPKFSVLFTQGNLNNHLGVPLTVLSINPKHDIAVVEMGANHQGEIAFLCEIVKPTIGYITNFGKAHLEGFGGVDGVVRGKSELYKFLIQNNAAILINEDDPIQKKISTTYENCIGFGTSTGDYQYQYEDINSYASIIIKNEDIVINSQLTGTYNCPNLAAACTLAQLHNVPLEDIQKGLEAYVPDNMRSQIIKRNNKQLILDAYNANPSSMEVALQNLQKFPGTKCLILGEMMELGKDSAIEHKALLSNLKTMKFDKVFLVGKEFLQIPESKTFINFPNSDELISYLKNNPVQEEVILIKGSRGNALEKIVEFI